MNPGILVRLPAYCPHSQCLFHRPLPSSGPSSRRFVRQGRFWRKDTGSWVARFRCHACRRTFSSSTLSPAFGQKRRHVNARVRHLLCSGVSQRRAAYLLGLNRKTVVRKFIWLATQAKEERLKELRQLRGHAKPLQAFHFDEMESFERSKCLPLSIPLAVVPGSRKILCFRVASMPATGPLAQLSRRKYGPRPDARPRAARAMLAELRGVFTPEVKILTDQNPKYPSWIRKHFPRGQHETVKGQRGCVTGQGELKRIGNDPLFDLNHTCAMKRANINRLIRRTWCTTKRADRLEAHLELYAQFHNRHLTAQYDWHGNRRKLAPEASRLLSLNRAGSSTSTA